MAEMNENSTTVACGSAALQEARDNTLITLEAGDRQLVVHRSVLAARSPVFAAMLAHDTLEMNSGRIAIADIEPEVLHRLLLLMYEACAPPLSSMAPQLFEAADKYCIRDLKAQCKDQLIRDLSVENVMKSALLGLRHSCPHLVDTAVCFLEANLTEVMKTQGWAEAVRYYPEEFVKLSHLVAAIRRTSQGGVNRKLLKEAAGNRGPGWQRLFPAEVSLLDPCEMDGMNIFHCAPGNMFSSNNLKLLLDAGADVDARDMDGRTALHYAAASLAREVMEYQLPTAVDLGYRCLEIPTHALSVSDSTNASKIIENSEAGACDSGALLEARDNALITLVAGETQMVVHRSVLVARSPGFAAMLAHSSLETGSSRIVIADTEPEVVHQLLLHLYKDCAPQIGSMAPQLLVATDKYCLSDLKEKCELQLVRDLSVENVMTSAFLALRHSCPRLKETARCFLRDNLSEVIKSEEWAEAVRWCPEEFVEVSRLVATRPAQTSVSDSENLSGMNETSKTLEYDSSPLLEATDAASVTLVAGDLQLAVPRSVLVAKSPVFAEMLARDTEEANSSRIVIADVEPNVVQQLVLFMYSDSAPQLCSMAPQLLVAAHRYCVSDLKQQCEQQLARDLSVENVVASAVLALRYSCPGLKKAARRFLRANLTEVMGTRGWAEAARNSPEEFLGVSRLATETPARIRSESQRALDQQLHEAVEKCSYWELQTLLVKGADVKAQDVRGRTALHLAAGCRYMPANLKVLLEAGADLEARDVNGRTALHVAAASGCTEATQHLLKAGARVDAKDRWLNTPLHTAIQSHRKEAIPSLLAARSDVNSGNVFGDTPLHLAAQWGNEDVVKKLLYQGASKDSKNYLRDTPLDVAKKCYMMHLLPMLDKFTPFNKDFC